MKSLIGTKRIAHKWGTSLLALLFIAVSALPFGALTEYILCFENDGAVHVEAVAAADCSSEELTNNQVVESKEADCLDCFDVAISATGAASFSQRNLHSVDNANIIFALPDAHVPADGVISRLQSKEHESRFHDLSRLASVRILA